MNTEAFSQQLLDDPAAASSLLEYPLPDTFAQAVVARLKQEADRHWYIDPNCSLLYADMIVKIGQERNDASQVGLGMMARGDAVKLLGRIQEAWETLGIAGTVFHCAGDEIGWARTRIGRLYISVELGLLEEALADAASAREIFNRYHDHDKLLRLEMNLAGVHNFVGEHRQALERYQAALKAAEKLGNAGQDYLPYILSNLGYAYNFLGDFRQALTHYERARALLRDTQQTSGAALADLNIAYIAITQGHYRRALRLLHGVETLAGDQLPKEAALAKQHMVECYLALNRYVEARDLARTVIADYKQQGAAYEAACTLMFLAQAEAELGNFEAAQAALDEAAPIYASLGASTWEATVALRRGQIALQRGDAAAAQLQANHAMHGFEQDRRVSFAEAVLLKGQALFAEQNLASAEKAVQSTLDMSRQVPALRYSAHLLLGRIAEARGKLERARRHYAAADATIQRVQRGLTITLRPSFLADKGEALRALMRLHLQAGRVEQAFETLEQAKSQTLLNYLGNREQLHWSDSDPLTQELIAELNQLREEHHWFYHAAHHLHTEEEAAPKIDAQTAAAEMAQREHRMRAITEQLYLRTQTETHGDYAPVPSAGDIQRSLADNTLMIAYYNDGDQMWAFTLTHTDKLQVHKMPLRVNELDALIDKLRRYIDRALRASADVMPQLNRATQQTAQQLYDALLRPLESQLDCCQQLVMIPYGALHYLPFHLLHNGSRYLIENAEVVVLPAASLVKHRAPVRTRRDGAVVLAHSQNGKLPQTLEEARIVGELFGGKRLLEEDAKRDALFADVPHQILHIAAHGEYRIDQPDFSYIQLGDGHLLSDDLMQHDLSYELVTLSACETGLARVAPGDELIGLGRGFLYAGAGALLASLWRVDDRTVTQLMEYVYGALWAGESKATALRQAQCTLLCQKPDLHPAFWGAFQLMGDPGPLHLLEPASIREDIYDAAAV